jgi:hypothetical protein
MLWANALVGVSTVFIAIAMQRQVIWQPFLIGYAATLGLAAVGAYIRRTKDSPRLALALVGLGIYTGFIAVSLVFVFVLLPIGRPLIDPTLIAIDATFGYHWPGLIAWLADRPVLGQTLRHVYLSSQQQLLITIILLSVLSRELELQRFLAVGMITLFIAVGIWWVIPSVGPSAFLHIPVEDIRAIGLHFTPAFGEVMRDLIQHGPAQVSPEVFTGIIAFPSYHIIMAAMVVWHTRGTPAFIPFLLLNSAMVPATLSHGGHHLIDLVAGLVVFAVGVWIAARLIPANANGGA